MKSLKLFFAISLLVLVTMVSVACAPAPSSAPAPETQKPVEKTTPVALNLSIAKSLTEAMGDIQVLYAKKNPDVKLTFNFGSSGSMRSQIEQGADVDLFMSASMKDINEMKDKGLLVDSTIKKLLGNKLVLVVPSDSKLPLKAFEDVTKADVKKLAIGDPASVPAGKYAEETLTKLNVLDSVKSKIIYGKDVREVLTWVATGNVEAGIVYSTEAMTSKKVKVIATASEDSHSPIIYPASVIKASKNQDAAKAFLDYLSSDEASAIFEKYGYILLKK